MVEEQRIYHEVANIFPLLQGAEYESLRDDVAKNGLLEPIWLHPNGGIIDGRNRHRACIETETPMQFKTWHGTGSLVAFVVSLNLHRRHLTSSQRAAVAQEILPMLETEARERHKALAGRSNGGNNSTISDTGKARDQAAEILGTNSRYVSDAKRLKQKDPDLFEKVKQGDLTIPQAKREKVKRERREAPPLPSDKYRVLYADPPWSYGNSGIIGDTDNYGHVHRHYPSMSITELCNMGDKIKPIVDANAVLFLWATSPLLEDAFHVIASWGFKYKTSFVWDKVKHNFGHYNSVRHELLLVCTRGSCTPDNSKLFDSVQTIERSNKHSEKPDEFREIIDILYQGGKRLELFARSRVDGWEVWGNE